MKDNGFRDVMMQLSNEELCDILVNRRNQYQEKALLDIKAILDERGVIYRTPESNQDNNVIIENQSSNNVDEEREYIYAPLIVGVIMVALAFFPLMIMNISESDATLFNILTTIVVRVISIIWVIELSKRFGLNKTIWALLSLLFGGWSLIAINIASWFKDDLANNYQHQEVGEGTLDNRTIHEEILHPSTDEELEELEKEKSYNKTVSLVTRTVLFIVGLFILFRVIQALIK